MSKRYVLLKDLPDVKAGAILKQGDGGLYYYLGFHDEGHENSWYIKEVVEDNPDWFEEITDTQKEFDQPKTGVATFNDGFKLGVNWCKKYGIPNDDSTPPNPTKNVIVGGIEYLSPRDVWEREKKAFEAARGKDYFSTPLQESVINGFVYTTYKHKYPTFEDYKKANP